MGILMGALGGAGEALQNIGAANQKADLLQRNELAVGQQRSDLALQKEQTMAVWLDKLKTESADKQREALADRLEVPDSVSNGIIANNAKQFYKDGDDHSVDGMADEELSKFAPSQRQMLQAKISQAIESGDITVAEGLTKAMDAGKVSVGYGGKIVDQNDIDPETGLPRVIADNSLDRAANGAATAEARKTSAAAAVARANRPAGAGAFDKELTSLKNDIAANVQLVRIAQNALSGATRAERPALQAKVDSLNSKINDLQAQAAARRTQIAAPSPAGKSSDGNPAPASTADYSKLWE